jgi:hypothetical protein
MQFLSLGRSRVFDLLGDGIVVKFDDGSFNASISAHNYIKYLQGLAAGKAKSDVALDKQSAEIVVLIAKGERLNLDLAAKKRELIPAFEVQSNTMALVKILSDGVNGLPDTMERKVGLSPEQSAALESECNRWRVALQASAMAVLGGEVIGLMPAPDGVAHDGNGVDGIDLPRKPRRGRPKGAAPDTFTQSLID